jgi:hypothetical protein
MSGLYAPPKLDFENVLIDIAISPFVTLKYGIKEYKAAKQAYNQRRAQILNVLGVDKNKDPDPKTIAKIGAVMLSAAGGFALLGNFLNMGAEDYAAPTLAAVFGSWGLASGAVSKISHSRKLKKRAREMDSWIKEARYPKETGLEKKVEDVELDGNELISTRLKALGYGLASGVTASLAAYVKAKTQLDVMGSIFLAAPMTALVSLLTGQYLGYHALKEKKKALKRLTSGISVGGSRGGKYFEHGEIMSDGTKVPYRNGGTD